MSDEMGTDVRRAQQDRLLEAALPHIVFDGWRMKAFAAGAEDIGQDPVEISIAFRRIPDDALDHFSDWADRHMLDALRRDPTFQECRTREKIARGVRSRLEFLEPHKEAVRRSVAALSRPSRGPLALRVVWRSSDRLWLEAGDKTTDFNRYSKRGLLSGIFGSTTLYWLNDESPGHQATWEFLDRRIETVLKVGGQIGKYSSAAARFKDRVFRRDGESPG
jgi:ubiquinone biosynthesis protein COQ9